MGKKRRKKARKAKAEKAAVKLMWPILRPIFLDDSGIVRWPDAPRRKRRNGGSGDGMPAR
jgi:hypothetical protein